MWAAGFLVTFFSFAIGVDGFGLAEECVGAAVVDMVEEAGFRFEERSVREDGGVGVAVVCLRDDRDLGVGGWRSELLATAL
jgi:hypothetical protein